MLAEVSNRFERIGTPQSQTLPAKLLHLLEKLVALQPLGRCILNQVDVFALFQLKMLPWLQMEPAKDRYVHLEDVAIVDLANPVAHRFCS